jgi:hypothetical protein
MTSRFLMAIAGLTLAESAWSVTPFPAGAEAKTAGMGSSLISVGPPALLYNPANLHAGQPDDAAGRAPYAELGMIRARYSYEHPDFDPVAITVTSPTATLGYQQQVGPVALGFVLFPTASGKTEIPGLPRDVGGTMTALEVETDETAYEIAAGVSGHVGEHVSIGVSAQHIIEDRHLTARVIGNDEPLVDIDYKNQFTRPVAGVSARAPMINGALSYRPALIKRYRGSQTTGGREEESPQVVDYDPAVINAGVGGAWHKVRAGVEMAHERWAPGSTVVKDGIASNSPDADLNNVTSVSVTAGYQLTPTASTGVGYARLPTPWGNGYDDGVLTNHLYGVDFGQLNGVDRQVLAVGGQWSVGSYGVAGSLSHARGERLVGSTGDNAGFYQLQLTTVSGSLSASF